MLFGRAASQPCFSVATAHLNRSNIDHMSLCFTPFGCRFLVSGSHIHTWEVLYYTPQTFLYGPFLQYGAHLTSEPFVFLQWMERKTICATVFINQPVADRIV